MKSYEPIGIPLGTRLQQLVIVADAVHVWIACKNTHLDYSKWQGTYLCCEHNGRVTRVTRDDALRDDPEPFIIKDKDTDNDHA